MEGRNDRLVDIDSRGVLVGAYMDSLRVAHMLYAFVKGLV